MNIYRIVMYEIDASIEKKIACKLPYRASLSCALVFFICLLTSLRWFVHHTTSSFYYIYFILFAFVNKISHIQTHIPHPPLFGELFFYFISLCVLFGLACAHSDECVRCMPLILCVRWLGFRHSVCNSVESVQNVWIVFILGLNYTFTFLICWNRLWNWQNQRQPIHLPYFIFIIVIVSVRLGAMRRAFNLI